jgi:hypothetical protein
MYPGDGSVYPGKAVAGGNLRKFAKNGMVPVEFVEMMTKTAALEAENEALKRMPAAPAGGRRPYAFDMTKVTEGGAAPADLKKTLFTGVDAGAIGSGDEMAHTAASARVIGNLLTAPQFGKSVLDPSFRGAAGSK